LDNLILVAVLGIVLLAIITLARTAIVVPSSRPT